jgi:hypothetical protein
MAPARPIGVPFLTIRGGPTDACHEDAIVEVSTKYVGRRRANDPPRGSQEVSPMNIFDPTWAAA